MRNEKFQMEVGEFDYVVINPLSSVLLEKLIVVKMVEIIPIFNHRVHTSLPLVSTLSQFYPHRYVSVGDSVILASGFTSKSSNWPFPFGGLTIYNSYFFLIFHMSATFFAHLIRLYLTNMKIFREN
jgi:hypothetical protein